MVATLCNLFTTHSHLGAATVPLRRAEVGAMVCQRVEGLTGNAGIRRIDRRRPSVYPRGGGPPLCAGLPDRAIPHYPTWKDRPAPRFPPGRRAGPAYDARPEAPRFH